MLPPRFSLVTGALLQGGDGLLDTVTDVGDDGRILDQDLFLMTPGGGGEGPTSGQEASGPRLATSPTSHL